MKQDLVGQAKEIDAAQDYLDRCLHHLKAGRWLISEQGQGPVLDPGMMEGNCWQMEVSEKAGATEGHSHCRKMPMNPGVIATPVSLLSFSLAPMTTFLLLDLSGSNSIEEWDTGGKGGSGSRLPKSSASVLILLLGPPPTVPPALLIS